jgi:hypothetical protein
MKIFMKDDEIKPMINTRLCKKKKNECQEHLWTWMPKDKRICIVCRKYE